MIRYFRRARHRANGIRPTADQIIRHVKSHPLYGFKQDARGNWYRTFNITLYPAAGQSMPTHISIAPPGDIISVPSLAELRGVTA